MRISTSIPAEDDTVRRRLAALFDQPSARRLSSEDTELSDDVGTISSRMSTLWQPHSHVGDSPARSHAGTNPTTSGHTSNDPANFSDIPRRAATSSGTTAPESMSALSGNVPALPGNVSALSEKASTLPGKASALLESSPCFDDFDERPTRLPPVSQLIRRVWLFTRQHVAAVGVVLLGICLWAGYTATQARSSQVELSAIVSADGHTASPPQSASSPPTDGQSAPPLPTETQPGSPTSSAGISAGSISASPPSLMPSSSPMIEVHVIGGVRTPGVVSVPLGSRVEDVLAAAGGIAKDGDPGELNLAAVAIDSSQIIVGTKKQPRGEVRISAAMTDSGLSGAQPDLGTTNTTATALNLNTATAAQLETLPGIGPVTASKIIAWRAAHERFSAVAELQEISGIGAKLFAQIEPLVRV